MFIGSKYNYVQVNITKFNKRTKGTKIDNHD